MLEYILENGLYLLCPLIFIAGFLDGSVGSGGLISIPAYLITGIPLHMAYGTNKLVNGTGMLFAALKYIKTGHIIWRLVLPAAISALLGSQIGAKLVILIDERDCQLLLLVLLPVVLLLTILYKKNLSQLEKDEEKGKTNKQWKNCLAALCVGFYDGFFGPGAGTFYILVFTIFLRIDMVYAAGNTKIINVVSNFSALAVFLSQGLVMYQIVIPAMICSMIGNYLGAVFAIKRGTKFLFPLLIIMLGILFTKVLVDLL